MTQMDRKRRRFLYRLVAAAAFSTSVRMASAQNYPTRPVRWIVPFPPGGLADIVIRLLGQDLTEKLGQPFVVENRPGAAGNVGTEMVVHAPPDGHTILFVGQPNTINPTLNPKLSFNFIQDIAPIAGIMRVPNVIEVHPAVPVKTVREFIDYAKTNPGKINFASSGVGSTSHVAGELFKIMAGVEMVHVPYRGSGPALTDLLGGQVQVMFDNATSSMEYIRSSLLRALAVITTARSQIFPDLPTVAETVPGYEVSAWSGVGAPKATPKEIIEKLNSSINASLREPAIKARLMELGGTIIPGTPGDFGRLIADETEKWRNVIRAANIKAE